MKSITFTAAFVAVGWYASTMGDLAGKAEFEKPEPVKVSVSYDRQFRLGYPADKTESKTSQIPDIAKERQYATLAPQLGTLERIQRLDLSAKAFECAALAVYHEAKNQSDTGQRAVYHVVANRVLDSGFPGRVCGVVKQSKTWKGNPIRNKCHFSFYCDGKSDKPRDLTAWEKAKDVVTAANAEQDITHGALWYHANYVSPYWSKTFKEVATIGDHIFYRK
jgi:spore germination cell wall hydrolase CwlJ-like protein